MRSSGTAVLSVDAGGAVRCAVGTLCWIDTSTVKSGGTAVRSVGAGRSGRVGQAVRWKGRTVQPCGLSVRCAPCVRCYGRSLRPFGPMCGWYAVLDRHFDGQVGRYGGKVGRRKSERSGRRLHGSDRQSDGKVVRCGHTVCRCGAVRAFGATVDRCGRTSWTLSLCLSLSPSSPVSRLSPRCMQPHFQM